MRKEESQQGGLMLATIDPGEPATVAGYVANDAVARLARAALAGRPLAAEMQAVVDELGFAGFTYAMSSEAGPTRRDTRCFVWSTLPGDWVARYGELGYIEIDPAVTRSWNRSVPLVWDAADYERDARCSAYFADARRFGVASGVSISFRDSDHGRIYVALSSPVSPVPYERQCAIGRRLGEIVLLALAFHDCFMARLVDRPPQAPGAAASGPALSPRETQCLELAAKGMTSVDIGIKLGIAPRTANFHFRNIVSKLHALNRNEAIALGIARGLIRAVSPGVPLTGVERGEKGAEVGRKRGLHLDAPSVERMRKADPPRVQEHPS